MWRGHSIGEIQALARWRAQSVAVYATLSAAAYEAHVRQGSTTKTSTNHAHNLCRAAADLRLLPLSLLAAETY